ncbi:MAG: QueT transporter family protein [Eubacteriales bacterium]|nr:QueT transporter family protein [Eubacteriales bacterium]
MANKPARTAWAFTPFKLVLAAAIAALYVLLCLPFASFSFGIIQFRLAEALTVLPAFSSAAVPGVFLGCLLSNLFNPDNLGIVDILGGSLTSLLAAFLTYVLSRNYRKNLLEARSPRTEAQAELSAWKMRTYRVLALMPPVVFNAIVVGTYLPYLLLENPGAGEVIASIGSIFLSQTLAIYGIGLALMLALEKAKLPLEKM